MEMSPEMEWCGPVVIDLGSGSCKAGEAAGSAPQLVVPSRVGRAKYGQGAMIGAHLRETWVCHEIEGKEAILIQKEPIHRGVVVNWDDWSTSSGTSSSISTWTRQSIRCC